MSAKKSQPGRPVALARSNRQRQKQKPESRILGMPLRALAAIVGVVSVAIVATVAVAVVALSHDQASAHWTDVTPDQLAQMMEHKDFTLLNVKTPYIGEIEGTDLYIPYDQLAARKSELPADKSARIVVYCRSGNESAQAAQTLLNLGYTNVWNLAGGMNAWQQSGRTIVNLNR